MALICDLATPFSNVISIPGKLRSLTLNWVYYNYSRWFWEWSKNHYWQFWKTVLVSTLTLLKCLVLNCINALPSIPHIITSFLQLKILIIFIVDSYFRYSITNWKLFYHYHDNNLLYNCHYDTMLLLIFIISMCISTYLFCSCLNFYFIFLWHVPTVYLHVPYNVVLFGALCLCEGYEVIDRSYFKIEQGSTSGSWRLCAA